MRVCDEQLLTSSNKYKLAAAACQKDVGESRSPSSKLAIEGRQQGKGRWVKGRPR